jgi:hypothetical protein
MVASEADAMLKDDRELFKITRLKMEKLDKDST